MSPAAGNPATAPRRLPAARQQSRAPRRSRGSRKLVGRRLDGEMSGDAGVQQHQRASARSGFERDRLSRCGGVEQVRHVPADSPRQRAARMNLHWRPHSSLYVMTSEGTIAADAQPAAVPRPACLGATLRQRFPRCSSTSCSSLSRGTAPIRGATGISGDGVAARHGRQLGASAWALRFADSSKSCECRSYGRGTPPPARTGFFLTFVNSFNEWHEGTQFEPVKGAATLTPARHHSGITIPLMGCID